jgi:hypothetical protein
MGCDPSVVDDTEDKSQEGVDGHVDAVSCKRIMRTTIFIRKPTNLTQLH